MKRFLKDWAFHFGILCGTAAGFAALFVLPMWLLQTYDPPTWSVIVVAVIYVAAIFAAVLATVDED